jgi:hypothetical protein
VVEQVECLGVGSLVGQGEGVEVDGVLEVDDEIASCAFGAADEVVLVGGGNERGSAFPEFTESGVGVAYVRAAAGDDVLEGLVLLVGAEGDFVEEDEGRLGKRDDEVLVDALRGAYFQSVVASSARNG